LIQADILDEMKKGARAKLRIGYGVPSVSAGRSEQRPYERAGAKVGKCEVQTQNKKSKGCRA
jgi:hypothetical protein